MLATMQPPKTKTVRNGRELIGFVSSKAEAPLGYFSVYRLDRDGNAERFGGSPTQRGAIAMLREDHEERTQPMRPWHVRTKNGSTVIVEASTERMALMRAQTVIRRWAAKELEPINAHVADPEIEDFAAGSLTLRFGERKLSSS